MSHLLLSAFEPYLDLYSNSSIGERDSGMSFLHRRFYLSARSSVIILSDEPVFSDGFSRRKWIQIVCRYTEGKHQKVTFSFNEPM